MSSPLKSILAFAFSFLLLVPAFYEEEAIAKICRKGKACGNTCIAAWKTCHVGIGTAVNASELEEQKPETESAEPKQPQLLQDRPPQVSDVVGESFTYRSYGTGFFLTTSSAGTTYKCNSYCSEMLSLKKGAKLEFLGGNRVVEFETRTGPYACKVSMCERLDK